MIRSRPEENHDFKQYSRSSQKLRCHLDVVTQPTDDVGGDDDAALEEVTLFVNERGQGPVVEVNRGDGVLVLAVGRPDRGEDLPGVYLPEVRGEGRRLFNVDGDEGEVGDLGAVVRDDDSAELGNAKGERLRLGPARRLDDDDSFSCNMSFEIEIQMLCFRAGFDIPKHYRP